MQNYKCILICKIIKEGKKFESKPINEIDDVFKYIKKGIFSLITSNQITPKLVLKNKCYEKNNNIIIDFEKNDGRALLLMNTPKTFENLDINNICLINYKEPRANNNQNKIYIFDQILTCKTIKECQNNLDNHNVLISPIKTILKDNAKKAKSVSPNISNKISEKTNNKNNSTKKILIEIEKYQMKPVYTNNQIRKNSRRKSDQNKMIVQKKTEDIHDSYNTNINISRHNNNNKINQKVNKKKVFKLIKKEMLNNLTKKENSDKNIENKINNDRNQNINKIKFMPVFNKAAIIKIDLNKDKDKAKENYKSESKSDEKNQLEQLKNINNLYQKENFKLKKENAKLKELENELSEGKSNIEKLNNEYDKKVKELDNINKLYEEQQNVQKKLKNSNENYRIENNNLKEEIKQKNKEIENLKNKIKELNNQIKIKLEKYEQSKNDEIQQLRINIEELERQLKISEDNNMKKEIEIQENKKIIKELKDEINQLKEEIKIKDQEIKELNKKIKKFEELIEKNNINKNDSCIKSNHDYVEERNNNKNKRIEIYAKNMNEINREKLDEKINLKEKEIESLKKDIINMEKNVKSLTEENNELKKKEKELDNLLSQKEKEISNLKIKTKELQKKLENDSKLINEYKSKVNNCINDIENSKQNINNLTRQILEYQKKEKRYQNLDKKEKELNIRANDVYKKEKELNAKSLFLENEANLLESEHQKLNLKIQDYLKMNNQLKNDNDNLIRVNQNLQNQILNYKQMFSNIKPNQPQNNFISNGQNNIPKNNQENNISRKDDNNKEIEPIKKYTIPTLIGLNNIGATCFINSTLQCLSQTQALTNYFLKEKNRERIINNNVAKENKDENQLSPVYLELIQKLWETGGQKSFSPYNFMNRVNDMNPLFKRGEAGDAKDFIIFVLEQMHKELKMPLNEKNMNKNIDDIPLNQYDKMNAFNHFFEEFKKETSILTDTFFGFNETTNICLYCKNTYNSKGMANPICYNYGIFNVLIFPLEEVKNMKINMGQNNINNIGQEIPVVTLRDCFIYNEKTDYFTGENKNYCNICRQLYESQYTSRIFVSPNVLILILNRGKGNIYKIKLDFQLTLDITDFVIQKEKDRINYNLYGVITHLGESGPNAHFVASCKSPVDNNWYRYNDAFVVPIPFQNFKKDIYDLGNPYILFYEKEK